MIQGVRVDLPVDDDALLARGAVAGLWLWAVVGADAGILSGEQTRDGLHGNKNKNKGATR